MECGSVSGRSVYESVRAGHATSLLEGLQSQLKLREGKALCFDLPPDRPFFFSISDHRLSHLKKQELIVARNFMKLLWGIPGMSQVRKVRKKIGQESQENSEKLPTKSVFFFYLNISKTVLW